MTTQSLPDTAAIVLTRRNPGSALAALVLADELSAERAAHSRTRRDLADVRKAHRAAAGIVQGWGLPWIGGRVPPAPEPLSVDLSLRPVIFDQLVAERSRRRLRRRGLFAVVTLGILAIAAAALGSQRSGR